MNRTGGGGGRGRGGQRDQIASLPAAGIGSIEPGPLSSLLAMASAAAAFGAVVLRERNDPVPASAAVSGEIRTSGIRRNETARAPKR